MVCYPPPLNKAKEQGGMPLPSLSLIPFTCKCRDGMGLRIGNGISKQRRELALACELAHVQ